MDALFRSSGEIKSNMTFLGSTPVIHHTVKGTLGQYTYIQVMDTLWSIYSTLSNKSPANIFLH